MITTLSGENVFATHQRLNESLKKFTGKYGDLAVEKFDGEEDEADIIVESIQALPFLSPNKIVIVRNGSANKDFADRIEQTISSIPDSTELILYEPNIDKRTAYFKVLKKQTRYEEFNNLNKVELAKWLVAEAQKQAAQLSFTNANYLVERLGENQQLLYNELVKLAIYDGSITQDTIDLLTEPTPQSTVFNLLDAAFGGQKSRALKIYEEQRAQKIEPQAILGMIAWQLQLLAVVKSAGSRTPDKVAKDTGMNPFPIKKAASLATKISDDKLRRLVGEALDIDVKGKTTSLDLDEALKTYITTL